jgi:hypothetical protein
MPRPSLLSLAPTGCRVTVDIPATGATAVTLESLVVAAMNTRNPGSGDRAKPYFMGGRINNASAAYVAGDSPTDLPVSVAVSTEYEEPMVDFLKGTFIKAAGAGFSQSVSVYLLKRPE